MAETKHERIWLEPTESDPDTGRQWCQENAWNDDADEYVLAKKPKEAIAYLLNRSRRDDKLYYQIGYGTEAFRLLTIAYAAMTGDDVEAVEKRYGK